VRSRGRLDLTDAVAVRRFFAEERPQHVFLAAAKVGSILANDLYPADFIRENLVIQTNVIDAAYRAGVDRMLFLGSSSIYPKLCPQPIKEEYLLTGPLEPTNRPYALAKIAGIEMCWSYNRQYNTRFLAAMPPNLYGPDDNFDPQKSHVLPALICKVAEAKASGKRELVVWGTGTPRRELLFSEDLAEACVFLMNLDERTFSGLLSGVPLINIGTGRARLRG
jgi:GDP-L-fucose synthase